MTKHSWKTPKREISLEPYHESIILMLRYGKSVERISKDLAVNEDRIVTYIKESGIEHRMRNRSWAYKEEKVRRKHMVSKYMGRGGVNYGRVTDNTEGEDGETKNLGHIQEE